MHRLRHHIVRALALIALFFASVPAVHANWLTHIVREAGEAGGKAGGHATSHLGPVGKAAAHLKGLTAAPKGALAAHATPEGHWQFANREGQTFTAGTPDELQRVLPALAPDAVAAGETKLSLYLSEDSVFQNRSALDSLPKDADLHLVTEAGAFPVRRQGSKLRAQMKPNLGIELVDQALFDETVTYLSRPLNTSNIRAIALEPGAANFLPSAPKLDSITKLAQVEPLDPVHLARAFRSIRGQTALVTGRVEGGKLYFTPAKGPELSRDVEDLVSAAAQDDVTLIMLKSDTGQQAGGRNWLWQKIEVGGLGEAAKSATYGDFLDALAAKRGGFELTTTRDGPGRIQISALPGSGDVGVVAQATEVLQDTAGHIIGEVATNAVEIHGRDVESQTEQDARLISGIPSAIQIPYLVSLVLGLLSWDRVRGWWNRLWPVVPVHVPRGRGLTFLTRTAREALYVFVFMPMVGLPAFILEVAAQTWATITAPFRWIRRRLFRREV